MLNNLPVRIRTDLQVLRGWAVLLVVFFHAKLVYLPSGYLGVDIFFVLSGYLITRQIAEGIRNQSFSLSAFYVRRAKRLLPAAYVVLVVCSLLSGVILERAELYDFYWQLLGAVTFSANLAVWRQTGYFELAAEYKPLLHFWSLALEEQYYLLLPVTLLLVQPRRWGMLILATSVASLAAYLLLLPLKPGAAFYLLPTRAWELGLGSLVALYGQRDSLLRIARAARPLALGVLAVCGLIPAVGQWRSALLVLVCLSAMAIIACERKTDYANPGVKGLAKLGDISYSLYLVHWPILAFAHSAYVTRELPLWVRGLAVLLALVLGYALHRFVERRFRATGQGSSWRQLAAVLSIALVPLIVAAVTFLPYRNDPPEENLGHMGQGFSVDCDRVGQFVVDPRCQNGPSAKLMIWGDSFAMPLVSAFASALPYPIVQATRSHCGPVLDLAPLSDSEEGRRWADSCLGFNQSVLDYLEQTPSIEYVVLSSAWFQYVSTGGTHVSTRLLRRDAGSTGSLDRSVDVTFEKLRTTILRVQALGKKVVVFGPPPFLLFESNFGKCAVRTLRNKIVLGVKNDRCDMDAADWQREGREILELLARLNREVPVGLVRLDESMCGPTVCPVTQEKVIMYRDGGHLSFLGAQRLATEMNFQRLIAEQAR